MPLVLMKIYSVILQQLCISDLEDDFPATCLILKKTKQVKQHKLYGEN